MMEEPMFIKCEPKWPSDTEEVPCNFKQNTVPSSDYQVKIKEDPHAIDADLNLDGLDIKMDKGPCSDEDGMGETHDEECGNTGGSSHQQIINLLPKISISSRLKNLTVKT